MMHKISHMTRTARTASQEIASRLHRRGSSYDEIRQAIHAETGCELRNGAIGYLLRKARQVYIDAIKGSQVELIAEKIVEYREIRKECWRAYELSKQDREQETQEEVNADLLIATSKRGDLREHRELVSDLVRMRRIVVREGRLPHCAYLALIAKTLDAECELLGLKPEKLLAVLMPTTQQESTLLDDARRVIVRPDPLEAAKLRITNGAV